MIIASFLSPESNSSVFYSLHSMFYGKAALQLSMALRWLLHGFNVHNDGNHKIVMRGVPVKWSSPHNVQQVSQVQMIIWFLIRLYRPISPSALQHVTVVTSTSHEECFPSGLHGVTLHYWSQDCVFLEQIFLWGKHCDSWILTLWWQDTIFWYHDTALSTSPVLTSSGQSQHSFGNQWNV